MLRVRTRVSVKGLVLRFNIKDLSKLLGLGFWFRT